MAAALTSLLRSATITDHEEVLTAATAAASANPADILAQRTRVVALIKLDRFDDALAVLAEAGDAVSQQCVAEKAYALYKTGKLYEAESVLRALGAEEYDDAKMAHIAAQVAYRAERFPDAFNTYAALIARGGVPDSEQGDVVINLAATASQVYLAGDGGPEKVWQRVVQEADAVEGSFETLYNFACEYLARGEVPKADRLLERALGLCEAAEDLSEEEKESEKLPIMVQRAHTLVRLGKLDEAAEILQKVVSTKSCPAELLIIARNNMVAVTAATSKNPYAVLRDLQASRTSPHPDTLFSFQTRNLDRNALVADLHAHKIEGVLSRTSKGLDSMARPAFDPVASYLSVLNASAHMVASSNDSNTTPNPTKQLQELVAGNPHDLGMALCLIQQHITAGRHETALRELRTFLNRQESRSKNPCATSLEKIRYSPGLLALSMTLHRKLEQKPLLRHELATVIAHCTKNNVTTSPLFLKEAGIELLQSPAPGHLSLAGAAFESLSSEGTPSPITNAGLVASFATTDPSKAEPHLSSLPDVDSLIAGINVESLIEDGVATVLKTAIPDSKKRSADEIGAAKPKPKRTRKLPKNYEEGKVPDPERWLPLRDRSSYKPKGRKGRKKMAEATQGGFVKDDETPEGGASTVKAAPVPAPAAANKRKKRGKK